MAANDPIGDMIARIKNAAARKRSKVATPASKMRQRVLDVLQAEGYIRGYATVAHSDGRSEIEIELKYFDGAPVIREIERVSKPGRRVYSSAQGLPRNGAPSRIRNRCEVTGRPRAFYRKLKMSRIALREQGAKGMIPGLVKSSW